mmetsp:Transcript_36288/g.75856  ORF Transcript_36288/g.75856 Transcript_36288/m.75856 type:complete len:91 (-) Transcript_36288:309-581(-)
MLAELLKTTGELHRRLDLLGCLSSFTDVFVLEGRGFDRKASIPFESVRLSFCRVTASSRKSAVSRELEASAMNRSRRAILSARRLLRCAR